MGGTHPEHKALARAEEAELGPKLVPLSPVCGQVSTAHLGEGVALSRLCGVSPIQQGCPQRSFQEVPYKRPTQPWALLQPSGQLPHA